VALGTRLAFVSINTREIYKQQEQKNPCHEVKRKYLEMQLEKERIINKRKRGRPPFWALPP
jgi:hypothetical protein